MGESATRGVGVEFVFPANHVESVGGLVYVHGGGWTEVYRSKTPDIQQQVTPMGIVAAVLVPWSEIGRIHYLTIRIEPVTNGHDQGGEPVATVEAQVIAEKPVHVPQGTDQRLMLGFHLFCPFPAAGAYRLVAQADGEGDSKSWEFRVYDMTS